MNTKIVAIANRLWHILEDRKEKGIVIARQRWQKIRKDTEGHNQLLGLSVGMTVKIAVGGLVYGLFHPGEGLSAIILGILVAILSYILAWRNRK